VKAVFEELVKRGEMNEKDARELVPVERPAGEQRQKVQALVDESVQKGLKAVGYVKLSDYEALAGAWRNSSASWFRGRSGRAAGFVASGSAHAGSHRRALSGPVRRLRDIAQILVKYRLPGRRRPTALIPRTRRNPGRRKRRPAGDGPRRASPRRARADFVKFGQA